MFHKEGAKSILITLLLTVVILFATDFITISWLRISLIVLAVVLLILVLQFFRNPKREVDNSDNHILAPVDGKVVVIEEVFDEEYFKDKRLQVSIFMSPANVHVNRNPLSGDVIYSKYHKGKYLVAWHPKSSTENERHSVVIKKGVNEILVKQIAGAVAKRIVNYLQPGMQVKQNEELGFIKFGSRVDILLPIGSRVNVSLEQKVKGGVTVLAGLL